MSDIASFLNWVELKLEQHTNNEKICKVDTTGIQRHTTKSRTRTNKKETTEKANAALKLISTGETVANASRIVGLEYVTLYRWMKRNGHLKTKRRNKNARRN